MKRLAMFAWMGACLAVIVWCSAKLPATFADESPTYSAELGETAPIGATNPTDTFPDFPPPTPVPPTAVHPSEIEALRRQLHDTTVGYLLYRGWKHNCAAPGGCWLWQKEIGGLSYRLSADDAMNVEFAVQAEEDEAKLRLQVSDIPRAAGTP